MVAPKLRFKEFDGDWTSKQLGKIIGISSASRVFKEQWQDSGVPFFRTSDVVSIFKNKENEKAYISLELFEELAKKSGKIKQGDLLVTGGGSIGIPYLVPNDQPLYFKDADLLWMKSSGIVEGSFLYNFFISPKFREYLKSISHTGTISHFTIEQAKATPFGFPSKEEQTKIASFLSAVDEKISQLTQKHQLLSQYKQGMMQKLFSQQLRFKADDGSEFGEWEEKILKDLFPKIRNGFVGVATPYYVNYGVKYLQGKNIKNGKIDATGLIFINQEFHQKKTNSILKTNDILMVQSGHVGECAVVTEDYDNANCHALLVLSPKSSKLINSKFVVYYFYSEIGKKKIALIKTGNTIEHILASDIKEVALLFPCLAEQTKIANFLSAIDQKIEVVAQQIEQAKTWKKGLLQQMFF
ncbi:restriction endonuclease subunit S [Acinetobacter johnsonii]|uniref:restriction endonuclease subunit S n=1 Tax=Acinetobacter johnsonii TaxID=40214 RepID=UPI003AF60ECA